MGKFTMIKLDSCGYLCIVEHHDPFVEIELTYWEKRDCVPGAFLNENGELE
jgi:hypothetical protein